jgi:hypothetical protein
MKQINLKWFKSYRFQDLVEDFKQSPNFINEKYPEFKGWGFYMFIDQFGIVDIGQAAGKGRSLKTRLKNETSNNSTFHKDLIDIKVNTASLLIKVAILTKATENGKLMQLIDPHDIEFALICKGNPRIEKHGIKRYRRESIEIISEGDCSPLPPKFEIMKGQKCFTDPIQSIVCDANE